MRQRERGYALIFVFALAATMALALYVELPRLALEMQRNREDRLITSGEQYSLAIKRFVKANSKYPQTIEELENYNGRRFLRRRYVDPLTGKDEWRLIHVDGSGRYTDSLTMKQAPAGIPGAPGQPEASQQAGAQQPQGFGVIAPIGATTGQPLDPNANPQVAAALRRRESELPGAPGSMPAPGATGATGATGEGGVDGNQPPPSGFVPAPLIGPNGQPIRPIAIPGLPQPYQGPYPTQAANAQAGGVVGPQPVSPQFGSGSQSFGGQPGGLPPGINANPAAQMIQQMLTTPNPRGLQQAGLGGTQTLGGGIAGVASKVDAEGIKVYNEKTNYKEWEFIYDPTKDRQRGGTPGAMPGQQPGMPGMPGMGVGGVPQVPQMPQMGQPPR